MTDPNTLNNLPLRPFPSTPYDADHLTRLERLDLIITNLTQSQKAVKDQILLHALTEKSDLDKHQSTNGAITTKAADAMPLEDQPNLAAMKSKWKPKSKDEKPADARAAWKKNGKSLFVEQESHVALVMETVARLEAHEKGTPAALRKFYEARERIQKEELEGASVGNGLPMDTGNAGAGSPSAQVAGNAPVVPMAVPGYDASRDPRRRR